jgi:hypothetical protein
VPIKGQAHCGNKPVGVSLVLQEPRVAGACIRADKPSLTSLLQWATNLAGQGFILSSGCDCIDIENNSTSAFSVGGD